MFNLNSKVVLGFSASIIAALTVSAHAADEDVGAAVIFRQAIALSNVVDMDFGTIDYTASAAATTITLAAADGALSSTDAVNYTTAANGTVGSIDVSGEVGEVIEISCEATGAVSDGSNSLTLNNVIVRVNGGDTTCAGLGTSPATHTVDATPANNQLSLGADLVVGGGGIAASGTYNTTNAGGDPITVRVVYQ